jgi:UDP-2,3-diacylglucosamine pyrophosphatase LpxH
LQSFPLHKKQMPNQNHYKTIVLSDIHMGSRKSKISELLIFLKHHTCDMLILNGDIIDGWQLRKGEKWKKKYTRFFRIVLKMMEKHNTEVVYLQGNHEGFLDYIIPFIYQDIWVVKNHIHCSKGKKYLVLHGDILDPIANNMRWLSKTGLVNEGLAFWLSKVFYQIGLIFGKSGFSFSDKPGEQTSKTTEFVANYQNEMVKLARKKECEGVICGHSHHPAIIQCNDITYMNSGDWIESMSALVEDYKGNWQILRYTDMVKA